MKLNPSNPLAKTGLDAAIGLMRSKLRRTFDEAHVQFSLDAENSRLFVESLERAVGGAYGKYSGSAYLTYQKLDLATVLPQPILYRGRYPILYVQFRQWLYETYGLVLEVGEFEIVGGPVGPLIDSSYMNTAPDANGRLLLRALPTSGRFIAGGIMRIQMAPFNGPVRLQGLVPEAIQGDLALLSYGT